MKLPVGRVYVLSNKAMPGLLKIGFTMNTVEGRVKELSLATGVPSEFVIDYQVECRDPAGVESHAHAFLHEKRLNKGREFFSISLEEAVMVIRSYAVEIFEEEISKPIGSKNDSVTGIEDYRTERERVSNWYEVKNIYWKTHVSRFHFERDRNFITLWQMLSSHQNQKMKKYQSVISRRRYNLADRSFELIYDCHYFLPLCKGDVVYENFRLEKTSFPITAGSPSEAIISVVRLWS